VDALWQRLAWQNRDGTANFFPGDGEAGYENASDSIWINRELDSKEIE
jgi:hypothetical protein